MVGQPPLQGRESGSCAVLDSEALPPDRVEVGFQIAIAALCQSLSGHPGPHISHGVVEREVTELQKERKDPSVSLTKLLIDFTT